MDSMILKSMFHGAACSSYPNRMTSSKLCPKGFVTMVPRNDSRLASGLKINLGTGFTELPRNPERGFSLFVHRNGSLPDELNDDDTSSWYELVRAKKELQNVKHRSETILKSVELSIKLNEEAANAKRALKEFEERMENCNETILRLQKEVQLLNEEAAETQIQALKVADEVEESMNWGEAGAAMELEAYQELIEAEKALKQAEMSVDETLPYRVDCIPADSYDQNDDDTSSLEELRYELDRAKKEFENVKERNEMILKSVKLSIKLDAEAANAKRALKESEERLKNCNEKFRRLQIYKDRLQKEVQLLNEEAAETQIQALKVADEVEESMIWGEAGAAMEREAYQELIEAEKALKKAEMSVYGTQAERDNEEYKEITGADKLKAEDEGVLES